MKPQKEKKNDRSNQAGRNRPKQDELQAALGTLRDSLHSAAERPDDVWAKQRAAIRAKMQRPISANRWRHALIWASAAMAVLLFFALFTEKNNAPAACFAGGDDQNLLIEIECALNKQYPDALAPAGILSREMERADSQFAKTSLIK